MTTAMATTEQAALLEKVVIDGDLGRMSAGERLSYYWKVCESLGLNPYTKPFDYILLNGKLTLYATKSATEQLAALHGVSLEISDGRIVDGVYVVRAKASSNGRAADATGAVSIEGLAGESKANALMKTETKACRRAVLRLIGLGWLDETEVEAIPGARHVEVNPDTGEIAEPQHRNPQQEAIRQFFIRAKAELGLGGEQIMSLLGIERLGEIGDLDAAWNRLTQEQAFAAEHLPSEQPAEPAAVSGDAPNPNLPRKPMQGEMEASPQ